MKKITGFAAKSQKYGTYVLKTICENQYESELKSRSHKKNNDPSIRITPVEVEVLVDGDLIELDHVYNAEDGNQKTWTDSEGEIWFRTTGVFQNSDDGGSFGWVKTENGNLSSVCKYITINGQPVNSHPAANVILK